MESGLPVTRSSTRDTASRTRPPRMHIIRRQVHSGGAPVLGIIAVSYSFAGVCVLGAGRPPRPAPPRRHRDGSGGGPDVQVTEPQVQGQLPKQQQLRRRVPHRELPLRRVQLPPPREQVLLQADLLNADPIQPPMDATT